MDQARNTAIGSTILATVLMIVAIVFMGHGSYNYQRTSELQADSRNWSDENVATQFIENFPYPVWVKGTDGKMKYVNQAYCDVLDVKRDEYLGKTDYDIWPVETAQQFRINDERVIATKTQFTTIEKIGKFGEWYVEKFPVFESAKKEKVIGVAGRCWPIEQPIREPGGKPSIEN